MITHAAIRFRGHVYYLPAPKRHHDVIRHIVELTGVKSVDGRESDQGFLADSDGEVRYLTRAQALRHARECGQLKPGGTGERLGKLFSEDVW